MQHTLESLAIQFAEHAKIFKESVVAWNEKNPTVQRCVTDFSLPEALLLIVNELKILKAKYENDKPQISADVPVQEVKNPESLI